MSHLKIIDYARKPLRASCTVTTVRDLDEERLLSSGKVASRHLDQPNYPPTIQSVMTNSKKQLTAVPTNIITGFLGAGKTSTILHLLASKPRSERWAILVNEFGEIGVDGSLFQGHHNEEQQVYIREVPGGCMCCAAGLPMQIALNQLLSRAQPHRLLIEPTGLGHPQEVMEVLTAHYYQEVLAIEKTVTLVDARNLSNKRYTDNEIFNQQIAIADIIVGNKQDLYQSNDKKQLEEYAVVNTSPAVTLFFAQQGKIPIDLLYGASQTPFKANRQHQHQHQQENTTYDSLNDKVLPECGFIKAVNKGEGFESIGWRFAANKVFDYTRLFTFVNGIVAERMKAVFITNKGIYGYNLTLDALTEIELENCIESRIEIIASKLSKHWEKEMFAALNATL